MSASESGTGGVGFGRPLLPGAVRRPVLRVERVLVRIEAVFGVTVMALMAVLLMVQVFSRYVLSHPLFWVEEVARLTMIWMVLVGIGYALSTNTHLTVTAVTDRLPEVAKLWWERLILALIVLTGVELAAAGLELADRLSTVSASSSGIPRSVYFYPTALGFGLAALHAAIVILTRPLAAEEPEPDTVPGVTPTEGLP